MNPYVIVVKTGTANIASIVTALNRLGANTVVTDSCGQIEKAAHLILPGVGTLAAAMERLSSAGLVEPLRERILSGRPTMAVCLGLQLLCRESQESPGINGLSILPAETVRFSKGVCIPHIGWNKISTDKNCRLLEPGYAYFANSFCLKETPEGWNAAYTNHGGPFVAAMENGSVLACQFHPELSGKFGLDLIRRWLFDSESKR